MKNFALTSLMLAALGVAVFFQHQASALVAVEEQAAPEPSTLKPATFACTPANFTLTEVEEGYRLHGILETPTPGFIYTVANISESDAGADMTIHLKGPENTVVQVISQMPVNHLYERDTHLDTLMVRFDKSFNWGPDTVDCKKIAGGMDDAAPKIPDNEETKADTQEDNQKEE
jgi:hypothetical protein